MKGRKKSEQSKLQSDSGAWSREERTLGGGCHVYGVHTCKGQDARRLPEFVHLEDNSFLKFS